MELFAIEIRTAQWPEMLSWYVAALQLTSSVRSEEDGYALLVGKGWRISLLKRKENEVHAPGAISLAIEVDDLPAQYDRISLLLSEDPAPVEMSDERFLQWTIHDPDGNRIKLFQFV
ncbi:hypothetical protein GC197_15215 [bacterium]|nr:hypothetical protein [bacterium]